MRFRFTFCPRSVIEGLRGKVTFLPHLSLLRCHLPGAKFIPGVCVLLLLGQEPHSLCLTVTKEKHISIGKFSVSLKTIWGVLLHWPLYLFFVDISRLLHLSLHTAMKMQLRKH